MNTSIYKKLTKKKKRQQVKINFLKVFSKVILLLFYASLMVIIVITEEKSISQTITYMGIVMTTYLFLRFSTDKIIQNKTKIINHINKRLLTELSLKE